MENRQLRDLFIFLLLSFNFLGLAEGQIVNKAIYGDDNRVEVESLMGTKFYDWSKSVAAMVPRNNLWKWWFSCHYKYHKVNTLSELGICSSERFSAQKSPAICTGFLVGENQLLTAGHCIESHSDCKSNRWIFGVKTINGKLSKKVHRNNVFKCKKIIKRFQDDENLVDYALIELNRSPKGIKPLPLGQGQFNMGTPVAIIGHPTGLPLKVADDAIVTKNDNEYFFTTNLDAFSGNSGSPVFNLLTETVEGILVSGSRDFYYDEQNKCRRYFYCSDEKCSGEKVSKISNVFPLLSPFLAGL